jgi:hypothetical protein
MILLYRDKKVVGVFVAVFAASPTRRPLYTMATTFLEALLLASFFGGIFHLSFPIASIGQPTSDSFTLPGLRPLSSPVHRPRNWRRGRVAQHRKASVEERLSEDELMYAPPAAAWRRIRPLVHTGEELAAVARDC